MHVIRNYCPITDYLYNIFVRWLFHRITVHSFTCIVNHKHSTVESLLVFTCIVNYHYALGIYTIWHLRCVHKNILYKKLSCRREIARRFVSCVSEYFAKSLQVTQDHSK